MKKLSVSIVFVLFFVLFFGFSSQAFSGEKVHKEVTGHFYYDIATGHKYIKNPGTNTYREFSQRGKLLRHDVPNTLPLLVSNKYIREMKRDHYLLYEKVKYQKKELLVLSPEDNHPNGWVCKKLLVTMN